MAQSSNLAGWINKIFLKTGPSENRETKEFDIGTTFDKIHFSETNGLTLADLSEFLRHFFSSQMFMRYCGSEPESIKIMEWYEVETASVNPTEDELLAADDTYMSWKEEKTSTK